MPQAIPFVVAVAGAAASAGAVTAAAATTGVFLGLGVAAWTAIGIGVSIVGTLAQTLLAPQPPRPKFQDGSQTIKQAVPPRVRCYGRYRLGGAYIEYNSNNDQGGLNTILCHCAHEVDGSGPTPTQPDRGPNPEEHWLNDKRVERRASNGGIITSPYSKYRAGDASSVYVTNYLGTAGQEITVPIDTWTPSDHPGKGLCCTYIGYSDLKAEEQQEVFPNGPPAYRATLRGAKIFDPRLQGTDPGDQRIDDEATWTWSDNAALVILDYLTRTEPGWAPDANGNLVFMPIPVGFGFDIDERIDLDSFIVAANLCDQVIPRKPHEPPYPDERRWRIWGAYELTEDRKSVLSDLLDACGGRLTQGPDGRLGLTVGSPNPAVGVTITDDQILEYDFSTGKAAIERINEVRATYVSQDQDWTEVEAGIQQDQASIERNGIETSQIKLRFVPSEGQAQRIARATLKRGNPSWAGRIRGTLALLDAWGERWVRLQLAELGIDQIFEITSMRLDRTTMSVEAEVTSYDGWWDWNPLKDEADPAPIPKEDEAEEDMPEPTGITITIDHRAINGQTYAAVGVISWDPPPRSVFVGQARYRPKTPLSSPWILLTAEQDANRVETGALADGQIYEGQVRFLGPRRTAGPWVPRDPDDEENPDRPVEFTAVADPIAPPPPTGLTAQAGAPGSGQVTVTATAPDSPKHAAMRFWRNSSDSFAGAVQVAGPYYGGAGLPRSTVDTPGLGDWWYFATAENWSGVRSAPTDGVMAELAPAAPVITDPSGPTPTYDRRPPVSGNGAVAGALIKLYANAVLVGTGTAAGDGTWTVTPSTDLGLGANAMTATQTAGGNESVASGSVTITVNPIDADAWAYIAAMTVRPSRARQTLIKALVEALKAAGVWTKLDCLYLLAAHHQQASRLNAKAPGSFVLTATTAGSTAPVFTADRGWQGGGAGITAGGYLASTFNATVGTNQLQQDSSHLAVWVHQASTADAVGTYREAGGGQMLIACKSSTAVLWTMNMSASADAPAQTGDGTGFYAHSRQASTGYTSYQGESSNAVTRASAAPAAGAFHVLRGGSGFSNARVSAACWGGGLSGAEVAALRDALHDYLAAIGAAS
ncbi:hypothetical protein KXR53_17130 [Inquilinus limosus]|uniref:phage tail protein n=1 Tax=Inquilinus limosus TaxID=171674 RepID=UPI003F14E225